MDTFNEQILDRLATKVADRLMENDEFIKKVGEAGGQAALDKFHIFVGKSVMEKLFYVAGIVAVGLWAWITKNPPTG